MAYDSAWVLSRLRRPGRLWRAASALALLLCGLLTRFVMVVLNSTTVLNGAALRRALRRPRGVALLTVANHHSCFDDPGIWGALLGCAGLRWSLARWTLAAHDVCFSSAPRAHAFALAKCVPVVRGAGVYQPAIDFCIERLSAGEWVHLFPEGRVNSRKEPLRLKWGVGRLAAAAAAAGARPLLLPLWHEGLDDALPAACLRLRRKRRVFISVGDPVPLDRLLERLKKSNASEEETRKAITDLVQDELLRLRARTLDEVARAAGADGALTRAQDHARPAPRPPRGARDDTRPPRGARDDTRPPRGAREDTRPPRGARDDTRPPRGARDDTRPPRGARDDTRPPRGAREDTRPPRGARDDTRPPRGARDDTRPPRGARDDTRPPRGARDDTRPPRGARDDTRPPRGAREDTRPPRGARDDTRPPRGARDDTRPPRGARDDTRPPRGARDDTRPPRGARDDTRPPRGARDDTRPPRGARDDTRPPRGARDDTRPPRGARDDTRPPRGAREDTRPPRGARDDTRPPRDAPAREPRPERGR